MIPDPLYVAARATLLDALTALDEQRAALILVGAQAIYLHTGAAEIAVAEHTADGDVVVNPAELTAQPLLSEAMGLAGFRPGKQPGAWLKDRLVAGVDTPIPVDLLVPEAVAGGGRRAARLGDHGDRTGRRVRGLEGALIDHSLHRVVALELDDKASSINNIYKPARLSYRAA